MVYWIPRGARNKMVLQDCRPGIILIKHTYIMYKENSEIRNKTEATIVGDASFNNTNLLNTEPCYIEAGSFNTIDEQGDSCKGSSLAYDIAHANNKRRPVCSKMCGDCSQDIEDTGNDRLPKKIMSFEDKVEQSIKNLSSSDLVKSSMELFQHKNLFSSQTKSTLWNLLFSAYVDRSLFAVVVPLCDAVKVQLSFNDLLSNRACEALETLYKTYKSSKDIVVWNFEVSSYFSKYVKPLVGLPQDVSLVNNVIQSCIAKDKNTIASSVADRKSCVIMTMAILLIRSGISANAVRLETVKNVEPALSGPRTLYASDYVKGDTVSMTSISAAFGYVPIITNTSGVSKHYSPIKVELQFYNQAPYVTEMFNGSVSLYVGSGSNYYCIADSHVGSTYNSSYDPAVVPLTSLVNSGTRFVCFDLDQVILDNNDSLAIRYFPNIGSATTSRDIGVTASYHRYTLPSVQVQPYNLSFLAKDVYRCASFRILPEVLTTLVYCDLNYLSCVEIKFDPMPETVVYIARLLDSSTTYDDLLLATYVRVSTKSGIRIRLPSYAVQSRLVICSNSPMTQSQIRMKLVTSGDVEMNPGPVTFGDMEHATLTYVVNKDGKMEVYFYGQHVMVSKQLGMTIATGADLDFFGQDESDMKHIVEKEKEEEEDKVEVARNDEKDSKLKELNDDIKDMLGDSSSKKESLKVDASGDKNKINKTSPQKPRNMSNGKKAINPNNMQNKKIKSELKPILNKITNVANNVNPSPEKARYFEANPNRRDETYDNLSAIEQKHVAVKNIVKKLKKNYSQFDSKLVEFGIFVLIWIATTKYSKGLVAMVINEMGEDEELFNKSDNLGAEYWCPAFRHFLFETCPKIKQKFGNVLFSLNTEALVSTVDVAFQQVMSSVLVYETVLVWIIADFSCSYVKGMDQEYDANKADYTFDCQRVSEVFGGKDGYDQVYADSINKLMHALNGNIDQDSIPTSTSGYGSMSDTTYPRTLLSHMDERVKHLFNAATYKAGIQTNINDSSGLITRGELNQGTNVTTTSNVAPYTNLTCVATQYFSQGNPVTDFVNAISPATAFPLKEMVDIRVAPTIATQNALTRIVNGGDTDFGRQNIINRLGYRFNDYCYMVNETQAMADAQHSNLNFCFNSFLLYDAILWKERADGKTTLPNSVIQSVVTHGAILNDIITYPAGVGVPNPLFNYIDVNGHINPPGQFNNLFFSNGLMLNANWGDVPPQVIVLPRWILNSGANCNVFLAMYLACLTSQPFFPIMVGVGQEFPNVDPATGVSGGLVPGVSFFRTLASSIYIKGLNSICVAIPQSSADKDDVYNNAAAAELRIMFQPKLNRAIGGYLANSPIPLSFRNNQNAAINPNFLTVSDYIFSWFPSFTLSLWNAFMTQSAMAMGITSEIDAMYDLYISECYYFRPAVEYRLNFGNTIYNPRTYISALSDVSVNSLFYCSTGYEQSYQNGIEIPVVAIRKPLPTHDISVLNGLAAGTVSTAIKGSISPEYSNIAQVGLYHIMRAMLLSYSAGFLLEKDGYSVADMNNMYVQYEGILPALQGYMNYDSEYDVSSKYNAIIKMLFGSSLGSYKGHTCFSFQQITSDLVSYRTASSFGAVNVATGARQAIACTQVYSVNTLSPQLLAMLLTVGVDVAFFYKNNGCIDQGKGLTFANTDIFAPNQVLNGGFITLPTKALKQSMQPIAEHYEPFEYYNNALFINVITHFVARFIQPVMTSYSAQLANAIFTGPAGNFSFLTTAYLDTAAIQGGAIINSELFGPCLYAITKTSAQNEAIRFSFSNVDAAAALWNNILGIPQIQTIRAIVPTVKVSSTQAIISRRYASRYTNNTVIVPPDNVAAPPGVIGNAPNEQPH